MSDLRRLRQVKLSHAVPSDKSIPQELMAIGQYLVKAELNDEHLFVTAMFTRSGTGSVELELMCSIDIKQRLDNLINRNFEEFTEIVKNWGAEHPKTTFMGSSHE